MLTAAAERPKSERKDRLLGKQQDHNCYLCGEPIEENEEHLDHVWPQNAGGGTGKSNLYRTHIACQVLKHDLAVPGDAAVGRFAFPHNLPRHLHGPAKPLWEEPAADADSFVSLMDDVRAAALRVALILQQSGKCHFCEGDFRTVGAVRVVKLETDLPWWMPNTVASCVSCAGGQENAEV